MQNNTKQELRIPGEGLQHLGEEQEQQKTHQRGQGKSCTLPLSHFPKPGQVNVKKDPPRGGGRMKWVPKFTMNPNADPDLHQAGSIAPVSWPTPVPKWSPTDRLLQTGSWPIQTPNQTLWPQAGPCRTRLPVHPSTRLASIDLVSRQVSWKSRNPCSWLLEI